MNRTKSAIQCNCKSILRDFQNFIGGRELVSTEFPSGFSLEEAGDQFMKLYFKKAGRKYISGTFKNTAPF